MARLSFPTSFPKLLKLFGSVLAKDTADGASSVIRPLLAQQDIVLADDDAACADASAAHDNGEKFSKSAEKLRQDRDNLFRTPFKNYKNCVQFLKRLFIDNPRQLGDWGVTVNNRHRVVHGVGFIARKMQVGNFISKHELYAPGTSPLQSFLDENNIDLASDKSDANDAETFHSDLEQANKNKETEFGNRDLKFRAVKKNLRTIGSYLVKFFPKNPHKAGDWGYVIDSSKRAPRIYRGKLGQGQKKTLQHLVKGSELANISSMPFKIFRGKNAIGTFETVLPSESFIIAHGYGTLTLLNESKTAEIKYEARFNN